MMKIIHKYRGNQDIIRCIMVSMFKNYHILWYSDRENIDKTSIDIGIWHIKYKQSKTIDK